MRIVLLFTLVTFAILFHSISSETYSKTHKFLHVTPLAYTKKTLSIQGMNWKDVNIINTLKKTKLSEKDYELLALTAPNSPLSKAFFATRTILSLPDKTGLNFSTLFPIALFAETQLPEEVAKGNLYWDESHFKRELQVDPSNGSFFIHLGTHGIKKLGEGKFKLVTKTILYDHTDPKVYARAVARSKIRKECYAMKKLSALPGIMQAKAILTHFDPEVKNDVSTIVTPIYTLGALKNVFQASDLHLTFRERLTIANDIVTGLASMHENNFVHLDLSVKNYFSTLEYPTPAKRTIKTVVADLGRSLPISKAIGVSAQGNSSFLSPEAFLKKQLSGTDYFASDLYALGCVLWELYFTTPPQWRKEKTFNKNILNPENGCANLRAAISVGQAQAREKIRSLHEEGKYIHEKFLSLIVQMVDPIAAKRGRAKEYQTKFRQLLDEYDSHTYLKESI